MHLYPEGPPTVFLAYCGVDERIADKMDVDMQRKGMDVRHDVLDRDHHQKFPDFMRGIRSHDFAVLLVSESLIATESCLFEIMEALAQYDLERKVLPVMLSVTRLSDAAQKQLVERLRRINKSLLPFFTTLSKLDMATYDELRKQDYRPLLQVVGYEDYEYLSRLDEIKKIEDIQKRETALQQFLTAHPGNSGALFHLAGLAVAQGKYKKAKELYEEVLKTYRNSEAAHINLSALLLQQFQDPVGARTHLEMAIRIRPDFVPAYNNLGILLRDELQDYAAAATAFDQAHHLDPEEPYFLFALGLLCQEHLGKYKEAKAYYEKLLALVPDHSSAHYNLALLLYTQFNDVKKAKGHYITATQLEQEFVSPDIDQLFGIRR
jgi:tetratricopeptide (TPR) repeat protein